MLDLIESYIIYHCCKFWLALLVMQSLHYSSLDLLMLSYTHALQSGVVRMLLEMYKLLHKRSYYLYFLVKSIWKNVVAMARRIILNEEPLKKLIENFGKFPIGTCIDKGEPRLLVTAVDIAEGITVTFDRL